MIKYFGVPSEWYGEGVDQRLGDWITQIEEEGYIFLQLVTAGVITGALFREIENGS